MSEPIKHVIEDISRYIDDSAVGDLFYSGTVFASDIDEWVAGIGNLSLDRSCSNDEEGAQLRRVLQLIQKEPENSSKIRLMVVSAELYLSEQALFTTLISNVSCPFCDAQMSYL